MEEILPEVLNVLYVLPVIVAFFVIDKLKNNRNSSVMRKEEDAAVSTGEGKPIISNKALNIIFVLVALGLGALFLMGVVLLWWIWLPILGFFLLLKLLAK